MNLKSLYFIFILLIMSCSATEELSETSIQPDSETEQPTHQQPNAPSSKTYNYLALGDSYTIGESVCETCRFPTQLKAAFETENLASLDTYIIARTGWRTDNLINAIKQESLNKNYDLVTLLIGVNNQYQGSPFSRYETEFIQLLETAIELAQGDAGKVIIVSIPDYAYTPFGQSLGDTEEVSKEIEAYNSFAKTSAESKKVTFINITDITRDGINNPELVASDGLHPSRAAYALFVERLLPLIKEILK